MSITSTRYGYRDRQTSLKSPKTGLRKGSRQLSGERALTSANTNVPPAETLPGGTKSVTSPTHNGDHSTPESTGTHHGSRRQRRNDHKEIRHEHHHPPSHII